ncbi:MAG TPA: choice-of-anchor D domain-containing protein, partial [Blastocatellia bacterium]
CPWLPSGELNIQAYPPALCPLPLTANLTITVPSGSADADNQFVVPVTGTGLSAVVSSVPEIDFGAETIGEASPPQTLTFTNQSPNPVTIAPSAGPCVFSSGLVGQEQPRPPFAADGTVMIGGLQLAETANIGLTNSGPIQFPSPFSLSPPLINAPTVEYFCDTDLTVTKGGSGVPNFQISADTCSGQTLAPYGQSGNSCSLQITFVPQPKTWAAAVNAGSGLDDFLQLNTAWCGDATNPAEPNCEVDSGRFPVEIKTNPSSPLRMSPGAGMDFGTVIRGTASTLNITLFNDPVDPNAGPVNLTSKLVAGADYLEIDTCSPTLASNQSCAITVTFAPKIVGLDPGKITFTYNTSSAIGLVQTIFLRGTGQ